MITQAKTQGTGYKKTYNSQPLKNCIVSILYYDIKKTSRLPVTSSAKIEENGFAKKPVKVKSILPVLF